MKILGSLYLNSPKAERREKAKVVIDVLKTKSTLIFLETLRIISRKLSS